VLFPPTHCTPHPPTPPPPTYAPTVTCQIFANILWHDRFQWFAAAFRESSIPHLCSNTWRGFSSSSNNCPFIGVVPQHLQLCCVAVLPCLQTPNQYVQNNIMLVSCFIVRNGLVLGSLSFYIKLLDVLGLPQGLLVLVRILMDSCDHPWCRCGGKPHILITGKLKKQWNVAPAGPEIQYNMGQQQKTTIGAKSRKYNMGQKQKVHAEANAVSELLGTMCCLLSPPRQCSKIWIRARNWPPRTLQTQKHRQLRRLRGLNPLEDVPDQDSAKPPRRIFETLFCLPEQSWGRDGLVAP